METKEDPTATRQEPAPLPTAGKAETGMRGVVSSATGAPPGRRDDVTLTEPNSPLRPESIPHESPITLRLNNAGQAWEEFNSMASTPPPFQLDPFSIHATRHRGSARVRRRPLALLATAVVGIGLGVTLVALKLSEHPPTKVSPSQLDNAAPQGAAAELAPKPVSAPAAVLPARREEQGAAAELAPKPASASAAVQPAQREKQGPRISAASDMHLEVRHKKTETSIWRGHLSPRLEEPTAKPDHEPMATVIAKPDNEPKTKPAAGPVEEFGMDLKRPTTRRQTKMMDEKDPYSP